MPGLGDIYKDESTSSRDRLLSARTGVSNILQNAHQQAGWAAPAVAVLQGQEAAKIGDENASKTKESEFMTTWGKLLSANPGAANKFWNEHAKDALGTNIQIDQSEFNPKDGYKLKLNTGHEVDIRPDGKAYGILKDGTFGVIDADTLSWYSEQAKDLIGTKAAAAKSSKTDDEKGRQERDIRGNITRLQTALLNMPAGPERTNTQTEIVNLKKQYKDKTGKDYDAAPAAPPAPALAPSGGMGDVFGAKPQLPGFAQPGQGAMAPAVPAAAPQVPAKRALPTFR